jgi:hypothetical protein
MKERTTIPLETKRRRQRVPRNVNLIQIHYLSKMDIDIIESKLQIERRGTAAITISANWARCIGEERG